MLFFTSCKELAEKSANLNSLIMKGLAEHASDTYLSGAINFFQEEETASIHDRCSICGELVCLCHQSTVDKYFDEILEELNPTMIEDFSATSSDENESPSTPLNERYLLGQNDPKWNLNYLLSNYLTCGSKSILEQIEDKPSAPTTSDSGIEPELLESELFTLLADVACEPVKVNTEEDINEYLDIASNPKLSDTVNSDNKLGKDFKWHRSACDPWKKLYPSAKKELYPFDATDRWRDHDPVKTTPYIPCIEYKDLVSPNESQVLNPVIKDPFALRKNSKTIQEEHSYHKKLDFVESDVEEEKPVSKRKRNEIDEDFTPYQKPKRKAGRPRTNFSKIVAPKTLGCKMQKIKASKKTPQASKNPKSCSTVPFDRREQHNQAERDRRDMLKKNLDIVEDATPDHILQLTQLALQSEKTNKSDELENNENNFTVDVLKKLDELIKKEPVNHKPKYKKASRNSKMVVLLSATFYISGLEKELKSRENRLTQVKKHYEECLKRLNPHKNHSKRSRKN